MAGGQRWRRRIWDIANYNAGPNVNSGIGDFFTTEWTWLKDTIGSLGATVFKVLVGILVVVALVYCAISCCGKVCSRSITNVIEKQLVVVGPMEQIKGHDTILTILIEDRLLEEAI